MCEKLIFQDLILLSIIVVCAFFAGTLVGFAINNPILETLAEDYVNCYWAFTCTDDPQYCSYEAEMTTTDIEYYQWECKLARNYGEYYELLPEDSK